jgi:hypothetical protein
MRKESGPGRERAYDGAKQRPVVPVAWGLEIVVKAIARG